MEATVAPPLPTPAGVPGLWSGWFPRDQWHFTMHASRPLAPDELHRLIKLNAALGRAALVLAQPSSWPPVRAPWYNVDISSVQHAELEPMRERDSPQPERAHLRHAWWEGWLPAGVVLLTLLLLIARATERCLSSRWRRRRGQRADEWTTPNVLATSNQEGSSAPQAPPYTSVPVLPTNTINITVDLPPPYTECANASNAAAASNTHINANPNPNASANGVRPSEVVRSSRRKRSRRIEEPPPPYAAVFANYTVPKYGEPSVHFYSQRRHIGMATMAGNNIVADRMNYVVDRTTNLMTYVMDNHINSSRLNSRRHDDIAHGGYRVGRHGSDQTAAYYVETPESECTVLDIGNASQRQDDGDIGEQEVAPERNAERKHLLERPANPDTNSDNSSENVTPKRHRSNNVVAFLRDDVARSSTSRDFDLEDDDVRLGDLDESRVRANSVVLTDSDEDERFDEIVIKALDEAEAQIRNGDPNPRV